MHPGEIILNGHATFVLVRRGYRSLSYSIPKLNQEYEKRLCKVGHCLQKSFSCGCAVGGHYFDYCQVLVIARTMSYIITLTMNVSNVIYGRAASIARLIILPHACRLNITRLKHHTFRMCMSSKYRYMRTYKYFVWCNGVQLICEKSWSMQGFLSWDKRRVSPLWQGTQSEDKSTNWHPFDPCMLIFLIHQKELLCLTQCILDPTYYNNMCGKYQHTAILVGSIIHPESQPLSAVVLLFSEID